MTTWTKSKGLVQKFEESGMPKEWILDWVISALEGYSISDRHIRHLEKKYELVEESTVESRNNSGDSFGIDDKNVQEQTVQVCACTVVALT